jgi:hypothetical protein
MESARADLARRVLDLLTHGQHVTEHDAFQLRNWALSPDDAMLSLEEIACRILKAEENSNAKAAKQ